MEKDYAYGKKILMSTGQMFPSRPKSYYFGDIILSISLSSLLVSPIYIYVSNIGYVAPIVHLILFVLIFLILLVVLFKNDTLGHSRGSKLFDRTVNGTEKKTVDVKKHFGIKADRITQTDNRTDIIKIMEIDMKQMVVDIDKATQEFKVRDDAKKKAKQTK